jgi:hypothetical protein
LNGWPTFQGIPRKGRQWLSPPHAALYEKQTKAPTLSKKLRMKNQSPSSFSNLIFIQTFNQFLTYAMPLLHYIEPDYL